MTNASIAVCPLYAEQLIRAQKLAANLTLPLLASPHDDSLPYDYLLVVTPDYVGLQAVADKRFAPFYINFLSETLIYRLNQASLRKELIARAMGCKPSQAPRIVDATAGLGRDSFILAALGFSVVLIERSGIIHALLADAMERASLNPDYAPIIQRMVLIKADAKDWLSAQSSHPDIIYLDPMFPERKKSASVKKEMVTFKNVLGTDPDSDELLQLALTCAAHRVVVKRPRLAANIGEKPPNFSLTGKNSRFDIYLV